MKANMKIAVLKISGKALDHFLESNGWKNTLEKIYNNYDGLVIVHGAGKGISEWSEKLGYEVKFLNGQRISTKEVVDVVAAVQSGITNSKIVSRINAFNINAVGLTGIDRGSFIAERVDENLGFVGIPKQINNVDWIFNLLNENVVPVFSSLCRDVEGNLINVNADFFTELIAASINAESVFFMSDVNGVLLKGGYVSTINQNEILEGISSGEITGGMIPKLKSCIELLNKGIQKIWIGSINMENIFDDTAEERAGTWIIQSSQC